MSYNIPSHDLSRQDKHNRTKIALFGHFGAANFGNESTLQAMLWHLHRCVPHAELTCICTAPESVAADYGIAVVPMRGVVVKPWKLRNPLVRLIRNLVIGVPSEFYRWLKGILTLRRTDVVIIPGTGLLTDAFSIAGWGPYSTFKWSVIAKVCRCQLFFVSIGAGPLQSAAGRLLVKSALSLADFRSYRDESTLQYLKAIGFRTHADPVYPDLAFSLPPALLPTGQCRKARRLVVGLGLMEYVGMYGDEKTTKAHYSAYLETLVQFVNWLIDREYDVRILIGDLMDVPVTREFKARLRERSIAQAEDRVLTDSVASTEQLLSQLAETDFVVGTRFHNVLLALLLNKPSIAISFHQKCSSLMSEMGLSEYCQDINHLNAEILMDQFCQLEKNAENLKSRISQKVADYGNALDKQYSLIFARL
ncbi:polysaccharide pyruvyl transferase family protein [Tunturiibacter psychrotolerans]|uniref:polysaccharide pyruvyl transferase family protein n=1 Tax=Tunturiibacter psychrotolerans TaxID=3069686 RepID=UPI003D1BA6F7